MRLNAAVAASWFGCQDAAVMEEDMMAYLGNREPPLDEVLDDPIVVLLMVCDRLTREAVRAQLDAAQQSMQNRWRSMQGFV
jgi:hypothetical protein